MYAISITIFWLCRVADAEKRSADFKQGLVINQNKRCILMGQIRQQTEQIFPAKRLSLFLIIIRLLLKAQTFFPPKDLVIIIGSF